MKRPFSLYPFWKRKICNVFIIPMLLVLFLFGGALTASAVPSSSGTQLPPDGKTVTGTVRDQSGSPLPGVTVLAKGTGTGQITDGSGHYSINVPADSKTLVFSFVGMDTQEVALNGKSSINVMLKESVTGLNEVVVVGYGTQKKIDLTGSVATVSVKDFEHAPNTDALQAIQGKIAGVSITSNSGMPGDDKSITIRGVQSLNGTPPMYVVDNVIMDNINSVNPNDIESISILKDAASAAIYGSRASGGVILITTKRGSKTEAPVITFHTYTGIQQYSDLTPKNLNTEQWLMLDRESYINAGVQAVQSSPYGSQNPVNMSLFAAPAGTGMNVNLPAITITGVDSKGAPISATAMAINGNYINTNWLKTLTEPGIINNYDLSVSGGSAKSTYYTSASYFKQQGLILNSAADRMSFRFNSNHNITDFLEFGNSLNVYSNSRSGGVGNPYFGAIRRNPISRPYQVDADGVSTYDYVRYYTWEGGDVGPLIHAKEYTNDYRGYGVVGNIFLKIKLLDGLTFTPRLSMDYNNGHSTSFSPELHITGMETQSINSLAKSMDWTFHWTTDYQLNYEKTFNKVHNVSATAIYSQEESKYEYLSASRYGTPNNEIQYLNYASPDNESIGNGFQDWAFVSYIGRLNYNYNSKYYIAGSVRRDGTSRYRGDKLWGVFPAVSGAWRISKEKFFEPLATKVNDFKIRASVGTLGNIVGGNYPTYAVLQSGMYAVMGPTNAQVAVPAMALGAAVNTNLQWESSIKKDIGFDLVLLNNKLTITGDYYRNSQSKMLMSKNLPFEAGKYYIQDGWVNPSDPPINAGHVESHGFELAANFQDKKGDFSYGISGNISADRNKLTDLNGLVQRESGLEIGQPVYSYFGYQANGIIKTQADLDSHPYLTNPQNAWPMGLGDIWTVDVNGYDANGKLTGKPDGKIDAADRTFIGKKYPDFNYGIAANFGWKRWSLQIVGYGVQGVDLNTMSDINGYFQYTSNEPVRILDRWNATTNPNGNMPKVTKIDLAHNATNTSSFWLSDASFFKINNVNLRYLVPDNVCHKLMMKSLEVYGSVQNLKTFTKYPGGEVDVTDQGMWQQPVTKVPQPRTWVLGVKVSF